MARLSSANTADDFLNDLALIVNENSSPHITKIATRFTDEVRTLERHAGLFGSVPEFGSISLDSELRQRISNKEISLSQLPEALSSRIQSMSAKLGGARISIRHQQRLDIKGAEQLTIRFKGGSLKTEKGKRLTLKIPVPLTRGRGYFFRGASGQSPYLTGQYGIVEGSKIVSTVHHEEWMLQRAESELLPEIMASQRMTQSDLHKTRSAWEQRFYQRASWLQRAHFGPGPTDPYLLSRKGLLNLVTESGEPLGNEQLIDILRQEHVYAREGVAKSFRLWPTSPGMLAHDVFSRVDPRQGFVVPEAVSLGRRPLQYVRPGYKLTPEASAALAPRQAEFDWIFGKKIGASQGSLLRTLYMSSKLDPVLAKHGVSSAGMSAISEAARPLMTRVQRLQFDISSSSINKKYSSMTEMIGQTIPAGSVLGRQPSGELFTAPSDITIKRVLPFTDAQKGKYLGIEAEATVDDLRLSKLFGSTKTLATGRSEKQIMSIAREAGVLNAGAFGPAEMITFMDDMRKNRGLFYEQLFSSLHEFTKQNIAGGKTKATLASNFASNPSYIAKIAGEEAKVFEAFRIARAARFSPEQMGLTFGAVPEVFGIGGQTTKELRDNWVSFMLKGSGKSEEFVQKALAAPVSRGFWKHKLGLTLPEAGWINKGIAGGMGQFFYGEPFAAGSGKRAAFEPRTFELLGSGHLGKLGIDIRDELIGRLESEYGGKTTAQQLLAESLASIHAASKGEGSLVSGAIEASRVSEDMYRTGFNLRAGQQSVYIPPSDMVEALRPHFLGVDHSGEVRDIPKRLSSAYRSLVSNVAKAGTEAEMIDVLGAARGEIGAATFETAAGKAGLLSSKMPGTANLTITMPRNVAQFGLGENTVGVPHGTMEKMFQDMERLYGIDQVAEMRARYQRHGKIAGLIGRRPDIDRFSNAPVWIREVSGDVPEVVVPEKSYYTHTSPEVLAGEEMERFKREAKRMKAAGLRPNPIRMSPLLGLAGDFDSDLASITLLSPNLEAQTGARLAKDQISQQIYEEYATRLQYMKGKASGELGLSLEQAIPAETMKLRTTKTQLGRISEALSEARYSVLMSEERLGSKRTADALSLITFLEQGPIAAKHVKASEIGRFLGSMEELTTSLYQRDASGITRLSREIIGQNPMGQAALEGGFTIAKWTPEMAEPVVQHIPGIGIEQASSTIAESMIFASEPDMSGISPLRRRQIFRGRGGQPTGREIETLLRSPSTFPIGHIRDSKISQEQMEIIASRLSQEGARDYVMPPGSPGRGASSSKSFLAEANRLAAEGGGMSMAKKVGIGLGIGGGLLLASALSRPPTTIGPEQVSAPPPRLTGSSGGAYMRPSDMTPPSNPVSELSAPTLESSGHTARLTSMPESRRGYRYQIRGSSSNRVNYDEVSANIGRITGGNAVVNMNLRDNRMRLNAQRINDLMERE